MRISRNLFFGSILTIAISHFWIGQTNSFSGRREHSRLKMTHMYGIGKGKIFDKQSFF
jgi:hypothetical protein